VKLLPSEYEVNYNCTYDAYTLIGGTKVKEMGLVLFSIAAILVGLFVMWLAIFGNKKDVNAFSSMPTDIGEFFFMIIYKLFPPFLRRVILFLLGLGMILGFIYLMLLEFKILVSYFDITLYMADEPSNK
jgi:hypothetical protein